MTIEELLEEAERRHREAGTDVRCPICNAAPGFFCRTPSGKRTDEPHVERLALA